MQEQRNQLNAAQPQFSAKLGPMTSSATASEQEPSPFMVAIGASGGEGLEDIKALLATLPADLPAVVLVVLHRPSDRLSHLKEVLSRVSQMPVLVAEQGERLRAGCCYIGEPDDHLSLAAKSNVRLVEGAHDRHRNRTVDILFNSVAAHARGRAIGIVLSGSLDDGSRGLAAIAQAGGVTMVLTKQGVAGRGMPENAAGYNGPIDVLGSATTIAREIVRRLEGFRMRAS
jgi:two-component system, chemotaxis family, protein-glutamate methylesterase/glutaminase